MVNFQSQIVPGLKEFPATTSSFPKICINAFTLKWQNFGLLLLSCSSSLIYTN